MEKVRYQNYVLLFVNSILISFQNNFNKIQIENIDTTLIPKKVRKLCKTIVKTECSHLQTNHINWKRFLEVILSPCANIL